MDNEKEIKTELTALPADENGSNNEGSENIFEQLQNKDETPPVPDELNLLPLRDAVVFPMLVAPVAVGREQFVKLIDESVVGGNRIIGIVTQRSPDTENPTPADIYPTGVAVAIRMMGKGQDATRLIVQGLQRFQILQVLQEEPYIRARVRLIDEVEQAADTDSIEIEALKRQLGGLFVKVVELSSEMPDELKGIATIEEAHAMTDLMAAHLRLSTEDKMEVLETLPLKDRMNKLLSFLTREAQVLELGASLQSQVAGEMGKAQREYYLREQLKAIQKELGEGDDRAEEVEELKKRLEAANLPEEPKKEAERELDRLQRMSPGSPEYTVARTYVDLMASLPWNTSTDDNLDIAEVKEVLDSDHYGLFKVKDRILEYLSVRKFKKEGTARQPILCLVGPPGVGKTSLGRSVAKAMGKKFMRISLGGVRDEAEIRGHRRTYIGAMPGQIIQNLKRVNTNNPLFMLDEIDKVSADFRGDPSSALLEVLDPEQNSTFRDNYLDVPFDLSKVLFICTANQMDTIQPALRDRMEVIEIAGYTEEEKVAIARQHLVPKQIGEHGLDPALVTFSDDGLRTLVRGYTREAGVRNLEREIAAVCRKVTRAIAEQTLESVVIDAAKVQDYLGAPRYEYEEVEERTGIPGVVTGLVWTPVGGDVIFIEAQKMEGSKSLQLTGQLGNVMQESARIALSYVRAHAQDFGLDPKFWNDTEMHVHVPAGAIPKDGPSAGVTLTTAMTSLLSGRPVKPRLAMTGEVTLTGRVLPVGGIKEKVLAAKRAGIRTVILPERNRKDLEEDIPEEMRKGMTFLFAETVDQVLDQALAPAEKAKRIKVQDKNGSEEKPTPRVKVDKQRVPEGIPHPATPPASARG
ncbi:MAG TPA: endopeptidase La [Armatimonadaceae bacterium]|nr:endopeptidase La [Armatimonadaceae bacterium]